MSDTNHMKRKQYHLTSAEETIVYRIAKENHISEAEVVRMAIRELAQSYLPRTNTLLEMAEGARVESGGHLPDDLSENHDKYLLETHENKS